jgi:hypothetical protein
MITTYAGSGISLLAPPRLAHLGAGGGRGIRRLERSQASQLLRASVDQLLQLGQQARGGRRVVGDGCRAEGVLGGPRVRQPLEVGERRTGGGTDEGDDVDVRGRVQPRGLGEQRPRRVADARRRAGDADGAGLGERLEDRHVVDLAERVDDLVEAVDVRRDRRVALRRLGHGVAARGGAVAETHVQERPVLGAARPHQRPGGERIGADGIELGHLAAADAALGLALLLEAGGQAGELLLEAVLSRAAARALQPRRQPGAEHEKRRCRDEHERIGFFMTKKRTSP